MTHDPKRPSGSPGNVPVPTPSARPPATSPPARLPGTPSQRPSNIRDALTEAHAIAGGALNQKVSAPVSRGAPVRKTVMIVDDDAAMRANLRRNLEPYYDVIEAKDGMEAVELTATIQPPAMIVSDVIMPRLDGFTLAKILRSNPVMKKVPIMFVSSRHGPQEVTQALVLGACHYFPKTTAITEIVAKIRKIIL